MAASLPLIIAEIRAALAVRYPLMTFYSSEKDLATTGVPPQVVFIPRPSTFGPPEKAGNNPRSLWTKNARLEVNIWGTDFEQADAIETAVIQIAHAAAVGSYAVEGSDPTAPDVLTYGHVVKLDLVFKIPILDRAYVTVVPTNFAVTPGTTGDGILEPGET